MTDLDKLRDDAEAARGYAEYHGVKTWTEHIFAALALADASLARIAKVEALHFPVAIEPSDDICGHCSFRLPNGTYFGKVVEWPCETKRALTEGENDGG